MATRFYLAAATSVITPTPASGWEETGNMIRALLSRNTADYDDHNPATPSSGVANEDVLAHQLIFGPIAAQTITGTIKGQWGAREANAGVDARAQVTVRIIGSDGTTVRGTSLAMDTGALSSEFLVDSTNRENRKFPRGGAQSLTSVAAQAGDYIVIEMGFRNHGTTVANVRFKTADTGTTDLPEDETTSVTDGGGYRGWFEFSQTIIAYDEADAGLASGTGTSHQPSAHVKPNAGLASGTGTAYDATVSYAIPPRTVTINAVDFTSVIRHDSYSFTECANRGEVGIGGFDVYDSANSLDVPALKAVVFDEPAASDRRIFTGYTHTRDTTRGPNKVAGQRQWGVEVVDLNTLADDYILTGASADRSSETDYARVTALLAGTFASSGVTAGVVPNSNTVTMDAQDYRGRTARDVLNECSEAAGKNWFIYRYTSGPLLYYDLATGTSLTSDAQISDRAVDVETVTLETLDAVGTWSAGTGTTLSAVATNPTGYTGTSLNAAIAGAGTFRFVATKTVALDLSEYDDDAGIKLHARTSSLTNLTHFRLRFGSGGSPDSNYVEYHFVAASVDTWEEESFVKSAPDTTTGSIDWADITKIGLVLNPSASYTGNLIVRDLRIGGFDDVWASITPITVTKSPDRIYSKIHLTYNGGVVTASNATTATNYRTRERHVLDSSITSSTAAQAKADELVANAASEITDISDITLFMPAANVNDIRAGQRVEMKLTRHGISAYTFFRCIRRTVKPATDVEYFVTLSFASDVLASANGGRGSDDVWHHKSNATDDGATVIVDEGGITVTDGAITVTNGSAVVIIDGSSDMFRIAASGTQNVSVTDSRDTTTTTLTGLGALAATPMCLFAHAATNSSTAVQMSEFKNGFGIYFAAETSGGVVNDAILVRDQDAWGAFYLNGSSQCVVELSGGHSSGSYTAYQKYYVLEQTAF